MQTGYRTFVLMLLIAPPCLFAQGGGPAADTSGAAGYRFLDPLGRQEAESSSNTGGGEGPVGQASMETPEEREAREKIRTVLNLIDGETIEINKETHIRLVGVSLPEFRGDQDGRSYAEFSHKIKEWIDQFIADPAKALATYAPGLPVQADRRQMQGMAFFYLYVPDVLLEDIRKRELERYDEWIKEYKNLPSLETDQQKTDRALTDLKHPRTGGAGSSERLKDVQEYVISEAKYFYENGTIKREEIFRDGKLMIKRDFDPEGQMVDEVLYDTRTGAYEDLKAKPAK